MKTPQPFTTPSHILAGETTDIYFQRTAEVLKGEGLNPTVAMEYFPSREGVLCGMKEALALLEKVLPPGKREVWALPEGAAMKEKEVVLRVHAPYLSFCIYETPILGMLAHCSGWATAARECLKAAGDTPVISFGARHVHPLVAGRMEYAAIVGGCAGCASIEGAKFSGVSPSGTMPHALILCLGDTVKAVLAFDKHMPRDVPRVALVDTFKDEAEESLRVAEALGERLSGVRLDTPGERGGVTAELVQEVRARLDKAGFSKVGIFVSGGFTPEKIRAFKEKGVPVAAFGVGSHISGARPIDFTADIHEVEGRPIAKRGRLPGITPNPRLQRVM